MPECREAVFPTVTKPGQQLVGQHGVLAHGRRPGFWIDELELGCKTGETEEALWNSWQWNLPTIAIYSNLNVQSSNYFLDINSTLGVGPWIQPFAHLSG